MCIRDRGVGNGLSLLIFAGIVSQIPQFAQFFISNITDTSNGMLHVFNWFTVPINPTAFWIFLILGIVALLVLYFLVKINEAQRIVTINYAKRVQGNSSYGGVKSILPMKLIAAGVIPVIFAVAFLSLPAFIGQVLKATNNPAYAGIATNLVTWFQTPNPGSFTGGSWEAFISPVL